MSVHVNYPHNPGYLHDCVACEARCHCEIGSAPCVFDGVHDVQHAELCDDCGAQEDDTHRVGCPEFSAPVRIARGTRHMSSGDAAVHVLMCWDARREISDACAATIASWWQSPVGHGAVFAALASGCETTVSALHDAIHDARSLVAEMDTLASRQANGRALDMLATWALHGQERAL